MKAADEVARDLFPLDMALLNAVGTVAMVALEISVWPLFAASSFVMVSLFRCKLRWKAARR